MPASREGHRGAGRQGSAVDTDQVVARLQRVIQLERGVFREIADDPRASVQAMLVTFAAGLVGGLGPLIGPGRFTVGGWVASAVAAATIGLFVGSAILWGVARLFGGRGSYGEMVRVYGYVSVTQVLALVPFVGSVAAVVAFAILFVRALEEVMGLTTGQAVLVVVIPLVVVIGLVLLAMLALGAAMMGGTFAP